MLRKKLLESLKKTHNLDEKISTDSVIQQLLKQYSPPSSLLLEEKSPLSNLHQEFRQFLQVLQSKKSTQDQIITKMTHLGFAKLLAEKAGVIPTSLNNFLEDLEKIKTQESAAIPLPKIVSL